MSIIRAFISCSVVASVFAACSTAPDSEEKRVAESASGIGVELVEPILDVAYGDHEKQRYDVYPPSGVGPFGALVLIHGGGWTGGDKSFFVKDDLRQLANEKSCVLVSLNYRLIGKGESVEEFPPVMRPLTDSRRALQHFRAHAERYRVDPARIALFGGSAGAFTSLWIALSPDFAALDSLDEVERQSTRVLAVGGAGAQTSIDPFQMREWVDGVTYGAHAFGLSDFEDFLERRSDFENDIARISPTALLSPDDPPILLRYGFAVGEPDKNKNFYTHSPGFGIGFQQEAEAEGVSCGLWYPEIGGSVSNLDLQSRLMDAINGQTLNLTFP